MGASFIINVERTKNGKLGVWCSRPKATGDLWRCDSLGRDIAGLLLLFLEQSYSVQALHNTRNSMTVTIGTKFISKKALKGFITGLDPQGNLRKCQLTQVN